jgi:hypothetical protein
VLAPKKWSERGFLKDSPDPRIYREREAGMAYTSRVLDI